MRIVNEAIDYTKFLVRAPYTFNTEPIRLTALFNRINRHWGNHGNPVEDGIEATTMLYFSWFMEPVLATVIALQPQRWAVSMRVNTNIDVQQPRISVTGQSGYVVMRGLLPCCVIEHKHFTNDARLFNQGIAQAIVYAAAIGRRPGQQRVLAIVTDLYRWRFLRVNADGYQQSVMYDIRKRNLPNDTRPDQNRLQDMLELVTGFLVHEWP